MCDKNGLAAEGENEMNPISIDRAYIRAYHITLVRHSDKRGVGDSGVTSDKVRDANSTERAVCTKDGQRHGDVILADDT
jgi:hypothetical protein